MKVRHGWLRFWIVEGTMVLLAIVLYVLLSGNVIR